jgi:hypothetical protein
MTAVRVEVASCSLVERGGTERVDEHEPRGGRDVQRSGGNEVARLVRRAVRVRPRMDDLPGPETQHPVVVARLAEREAGHVEALVE